MEKTKVVIDVYLGRNFTGHKEMGNKSRACGIAARIAMPVELQSTAQRMAVSSEDKALIPLALDMIISMMPEALRNSTLWQIRLHYFACKLQLRISDARSELSRRGPKGGRHGKRTYACDKFEHMIDLIDRGQLLLIECDKSDPPAIFNIVELAAAAQTKRCNKSGMYTLVSEFEPFDETMHPFAGSKAQTVKQRLPSDVAEKRAFSWQKVKKPALT